MVSVFAAIVWFFGAHLSINGSYPLTSGEKRFYVLLLMYLLWGLKTLLIDMDKPHPAHYPQAVRQGLAALEQRFLGALTFLKSTKLHQLPIVLLIGEKEAGKTTLLTNNSINFLLRKTTDREEDTCDWWVKRDAAIIDVPGQFLTPSYDSYWHFLLRLIKKHHSPGIKEILLAIPYSELAKPVELRAYLKTITHRLQEVATCFNPPLTCRIIITQCDQMTGFTDFFTDNTQTVNETWGITLSTNHPATLTESMQDQLNGLIKSINEKLITRLHHERNPVARVKIKEFPLQIEKCRKALLDIIKTLTSKQKSFFFSGIYFTSALQPSSNYETMTDSKAVQVIAAPTIPSQPYFVDQTLSGKHAPAQIALPKQGKSWPHVGAYATALTLLGITIFTLGKNFQQGLSETKTLTATISEFRQLPLHSLAPNIRLQKTAIFLDALHRKMTNQPFTVTLKHLAAFYTHEYQDKSAQLYQQALRQVLLPQVNSALSQYLTKSTTAANSNTYAVLASYLMLNDASHRDPLYISHALHIIYPDLSATTIESLTTHLTALFQKPLPVVKVDQTKIIQARKFLNALPSLSLAAIILENNHHLSFPSAISPSALALDDVFSVSNNTLIPTLYTSDAFTLCMNQYSEEAANEALAGNWVIGANALSTTQLTVTAQLSNDLRAQYLNQYVATWENLLASIHLANMDSLPALDGIIINLISNDSPFLHLFTVVRANTGFPEVTAISTELAAINQMTDKSNTAQTYLYGLFTSLQTLHQHLQTITTATDMEEAAFSAVSKRAAGTNNTDVISTLVQIADQSPAPINKWLITITDQAWKLALQNAARYLNASWANTVLPVYKQSIANHYPFSAEGPDTNLDRFRQFFGNPGTIYSFYQHYLLPLIDTSSATWQWKKVGDTRLPFSDTALRQIQFALQIHTTFFPANNDMLALTFSVQPYDIASTVNQVSFKLNNKSFIDANFDDSAAHKIMWPSTTDHSGTSIVITLNGNKKLRYHYAGDWSLFKLANSRFDSALNSKEVVINLSKTNQITKYVFYTENKNPLMVGEMQHFILPDSLT